MPDKPGFRVERLYIVGSPAQSAKACVDTETSTSPRQFIGPGSIVILVIERVRYTLGFRRVEDDLTERVCVADV